MKYLKFVHAAARHAILCFSNLYCYAKDKPGPLKPVVETIEGTVKNVVGPVYDRFHDVPLELLKFVDWLEFKNVLCMIGLMLSCV